MLECIFDCPAWYRVVDNLVPQEFSQWFDTDTAIAVKWQEVTMQLSTR